RRRCPRLIRRVSARKADREHVFRKAPGERKISRHDRLAPSEDDGVLDGVLELANVAGPGVLAELPQRFDADPLHLAPGTARVPLQKVISEEHDVLFALSERRQKNGDYV